MLIKVDECTDQGQEYSFRRTWPSEGADIYYFGSVEFQVGNKMQFPGILQTSQVISPPVAPAQGGKVLSAGRAGGQTALGLPARVLQPIGADSASRVRIAGLRPPFRMPAPAKMV